MSVKVYYADELSNDDYHNAPEFQGHVSGSSLWTLFNKCPAALRYAESKKDNKALIFGTTGHTNILEQERFMQEYIRHPAQEQFTNLITSQAGIKSFLKEAGIAGYSTKSEEELIDMVKQADPTVNIWHDIVRNTLLLANGREIVPAADYDRCMRMREVISMNGEMSKIISSGKPEVSIFFEVDGVPCKVRIDRVTDDAEIWDYKTTRSAKPDYFGKYAVDLGYHLKMALQAEGFRQAYGIEPKVVGLLAQEHEAPFLAMQFPMTAEQLFLGRMQFRAAAQIYKACSEADAWPSYNGGVTKMVLPTPKWYLEQNKELLQGFNQ